MRILVVCGAGASSTFVALRVRRAAAAADLPLTAFAGAEQSLPIDLDSADIVLVGPHLSRSLDDIRALAAPRGVSVALLPDDIFTDLDGSRALALAVSARGGAAAVTEGSAARNPTPTTEGSAPRNPTTPADAGPASA
ncbi:PTS sugar transporter subunit IIB [Microbacterium marinilacus]|uniref:PTS EIIB type-3 domain-containing protein n=1 Tax=Microbacterium marinilacus TaxID=415209 RepID=A0ABP7BBJ4_9MICO|nr:PTS sugar transporter [Microbacterium marinilacus]MBY0687159.1 PTS sugar transporter [Microbacterium marinilacus]